jgi:DNA-binding transcriptional ArsR family regulator
MRTGRTGQLRPLNLDASKVLLRLWPVVSNVTTGERPSSAGVSVAAIEQWTPSGTHMFPIAFGAGGLAPRTCRATEESVRGEFESLLNCKVFSERDTMKTLPESKTPSPVFIGRWTPKILFSLKERPYRPGELRRHLGSVSQRMLTRALRSLESTGLISRRVMGTKAIARVFVDPAGKDDHRPTRRHVPLGKAILQGGDC